MTKAAGHRARRTRAIAVLTCCCSPLNAALLADDLPLNLNLDRIALPIESETRLFKVLLVGDSQMGEAPNRLAGQAQKWDADLIGRLVTCESQSGSGVFFTSITGDTYGATLSSVRVALGEDHGDGNTGSHFHHSRRFTVNGTISPDFSTLGTIGLSAGSYARTPQFDARKNARVAVYDRDGGFSRFRLSEVRGNTVGAASDLGAPGDDGPTLTGSGQVRWFHRPIAAAGELGAPGALPVGVRIQDSDGQDQNRSLHLLGALIHDSPAGNAFPDRGLVVSHVSRAGWSARDHLDTLRPDAIDALIEMAEGYDLVLIMLGHNREDDFDPSFNPDAYEINVRTLAERFRSAQAALGYPTPDVLLVAPWMRGEDVGTPRLLIVAGQLHRLSQRHGYGFINLYDYFGAVPPHGLITNPRTTTTYTLDIYRSHPADAATASNLMKDIEWHFDPANWVVPCPADLDPPGAPDGLLNFFDVAAYLGLYNAQNPAADFAEPFGTLNFFDVAAFIAAYNAGCP